jgi:hypothetical protein
MTTEKELGRHEADIEHLKERLNNHEAAVDARLAKIEGYLQEIRDAANMGKGMFWLLLKIGAIISAMVAFAVWIWEKLPRLGH